MCRIVTEELISNVVLRFSPLGYSCGIQVICSQVLVLYLLLSSYHCIVWRGYRKLQLAL